MYRKAFKDISLYQFANLSPFPEISHYVSGRTADGAVGDFNLSFKVGDAAEARKNRSLLAHNLGIQNDCMLFPDQTHSTNVQVIRNCSNALDANIDALITAIPGICINVMSADCVPILLYDPKAKVIAAIHSGWRGTVGKIVTKTLQTMQDHFSSQAKDVIASIGPSICAEVYEVGNEVVDAVTKSFPKFHSKVILAQDGKPHLDLWQANVLQLQEAGLPLSSIEVAGICTYKSSNHFFSARKESISTGRFAVGICLTKAL
ncbi:MAG TPA: peptidoglycan editing factor PgeF [Cytophagaceae bacterium]|jgi:hypothetical protein